MKNFVLGLTVFALVGTTAVVAYANGYIAAGNGHGVWTTFAAAKAATDPVKAAAESAYSNCESNRNSCYTNKYATISYLASAQSKISALPNGDAKTGFQTEHDAIQTSLLANDDCCEGDSSENIAFQALYDKMLEASELYATAVFINDNDQNCLNHFSSAYDKYKEADLMAFFNGAAWSLANGPLNTNRTAAIALNNAVPGEGP